MSVLGVITSPDTGTTSIADQLTGLGKLVAVRKSLTDSDLAVDDLDQIIAKTVENVQKDTTLRSSDGNLYTLLEQLNSIRTDMIAIDLDFFGVDALIDRVIAAICEKMEIIREFRHPFGTTIIPLTSFTVASKVIEPNLTSYLELVYSSQQDSMKDSIFLLFDGVANLHAADEALGFKIGDIRHVCWSESSDMVRVEVNDPSTHLAHRTVFLETIYEEGVREFLDKLSDSELLGKAVAVQCETGGDSVFTSNPPATELQLGLTSHGRGSSPQFYLFDGASIIGEYDATLNFMGDQVLKVYWSKSNNTIRLSFHEYILRETFLETMDECGAQSFIDILMKIRKMDDSDLDDSDFVENVTV
ncbi:MAG: hypothetical protein Q9168_007792 [Polycauliona sp. 1 TL-2023]